jgi:hypothetical protein
MLTLQIIHLFYSTDIILYIYRFSTKFPQPCVYNGRLQSPPPFLSTYSLELQLRFSHWKFFLSMYKNWNGFPNCCSMFRNLYRRIVLVRSWASHKTIKRWWSYKESYNHSLLNLLNLRGSGFKIAVSYHEFSGHANGFGYQHKRWNVDGKVKCIRLISCEKVTLRMRYSGSKAILNTKHPAVSKFLT